MNSEFTLDKTSLPTGTQESIETLFALSNGHLGVRASRHLKSRNQFSAPGTFINGFYDKHPITYGEWAYGYAKNHQTIVKLPDIRSIILELDGENSEDESWTIINEKCQLDLETGRLVEEYFIKIKENKQFYLTIESFVSLKVEEVYVSKYIISRSNFSGTISLKKTISIKDNKKVMNESEHDPRVAVSKSQLKMHSVNSQIGKMTTQFSKQSLLFFQANLIENQLINSDPWLSTMALDIEPNKESCGVNFVGISHIVNDCNVSQEKITAFENIENTLDYDFLLNEQKKIYKNFWWQSDIVIVGNEQLQKGLRFNLFHLFQNSGRDGKTNFPAKGLTGEGYEGHYFWDTEMYLLPFFIYTQPEIAKSLLKYRAYILPQAKERAKIMGQKEGALFAWRTINGEEASAYYPAGTAQVHINADISYAFQLYEKVTGDNEFIRTTGMQVIFETARFWLSYGAWVEKNGETRFCINGVTGPDEYTALVNNNYYTNKMAQNNLEYAAELAKRYYSNEMDNEIEAWLTAAKKMYLPYDQKRQLIKQDESFFDKEIWPFEETTDEKYPLLLHYHPMIIYKYQVCKQADSLLAEMLFPEDYSKEQLSRDYQYYESITTHDSSLSRSIFSILASRTNQYEKGYSYFMDTALMDLTDLQGNVKDGIHAANMGGSWLSMIYGFAGLICKTDEISVQNCLPKEIQSLVFRLKIRGNTIQFMIKEEITAEIIEYGQQITIQRDKSTIRIKF